MYNIYLMSRNYLNNRDMLREIHLSKNTYCTFADPATDHQYDVIISGINVQSSNELNTAISNNISAAQTARCERIKKETGEEVAPENISISDLVFRVMTWDHIPLAPPKVSKTAKINRAKKLVEEFDIDSAATEDDPIVEDLMDPAHVRVNFPPFQHFRMDPRNTELSEAVSNWLYPVICVGKSHWQGDLFTGEYCKSHGQMTENLALMFIKLCDRYGSSSNWRYYTYNDEMRGASLLQLSQVGLQFDESKSVNPFGYFTMILQNSFTRILNLEKKNQAIRDDILEMNGLTPSFARQAQWRSKNEQLLKSK
jgi:hypothetical protein